MTAWYTVDEVSHHFGVSRYTVSEWIRCGDLRAVNVAPTASRKRRLRIHSDDMRTFERVRAVGQQQRPRQRSRRAPELKVVKYSKPRSA